METSASFEARYAPLLYPTNQGKPALGPSSAHKGHAFLDEWSATRKLTSEPSNFRIADEPDGIAYRSAFLWLRNNLGRCFDSGYRLANLPVVSVRIDDPSQAPTMLISDWPHRHGSGSNGLGECRV
jgi:hypothetical protein